MTKHTMTDDQIARIFEDAAGKCILYISGFTLYGD